MNSFTISTSPSGQGRTQRNRQKRQRQRARRRQQVTTAPSSTTTVTVSPSVNQTGARRRRGGGGRVRGSMNGLSPVSRFYIGSVLDPCGPTGAKVPDASSMRTSTARLTRRLILPITADGYAFLVSPMIYNSIGRFDPAAEAPYTVGSFDGAESFAGVYERYRPVSMCLDMEFIGTDEQNGGLYFGGRAPTGWNPPDQTVAAFAGLHGAAMVPVRGHGGVRVTWCPEDNSDWEFIPTDLGVARRPNPNIAGQRQAWPVGYYAGTNEDGTPQGPLLSGTGPWEYAAVSAFPSIYAGVTGSTNGASVVVNITLNVECIPNQAASSFVSSSPSPSDPVGMGKASSVLESIPAVTAGIAGVGTLLAGGAISYANAMSSQMTGPRRSRGNLYMGSSNLGSIV